MSTAILADDEPHMRAALREQLLALWPGFRVLGEAEDGIAALAMIQALQPDIAFLDIRMPGLTGLQVAHALTVGTRVVFVTAFDNHALQAFEANAVDYVLKPLATERLARVVAKLQQGAPLQGLAAALARALPGYMQPREIVVRTPLPVLANGKLDRAGLKRDLS